MYQHVNLGVRVCFQPAKAAGGITYCIANMCIDVYVDMCNTYYGMCFDVTVVMQVHTGSVWID